MINSDFDTIIRYDNNIPNKGKSKLKIFIIIFIIILLVTAGAFGYIYYSKYQASIPKIKFFEYIDDTNINKITNANIVNALANKIINSSYNIENELKINSSDENIKLPIIKFNYKKNNSNLNMAELFINESIEKELIKFTILEDDENIGIKSDEIVIKYIGSKKNNLGSLMQKMNIVDTTQEDNFINSKIEIPNQKILEKYKNIINMKLTEDKFSIEENVLLTQNESSMNTILYELKLSKDEVLQILTEIKNQLVNDTDLINCFVTGEENVENNIELNYLNLIFGNKIDCNSEEIIENIEVKFNDLYSKISSMEKFDYLYLDIYVNNDVVVKKSIRIGEYLEINLEEGQKSLNENYAKLTALTSKDSNQKDAIIFNINRLDNNVSTIIDLELSTTKSSKINNKLSINMTLEGNENSTNLTNKLSINYANEYNRITADLNSKIQFGFEEEIETLNLENCLFLDELDDNSLNDVVNQIISKANEIADLKQKEFSEEEVIVEDVFENLVDMDGQTEEEKKEELKQKLISTISNQMTLAEQEGREYALTNLQDLQIEGSTVSVMVGENMAIIAIDGYTFYLDPNFVLTEE